MSRTIPCRIAGAFLACAIVAATAHAQRDGFEGGAIIIQGGSLGRTATPVPDPVPPDEELARVGISTELLTLAARLDHPEFETRERAMEAIVGMPGDNLQIFALLARKTLTAEQHYRLLAAVRQRVIGTPRGALGISMNPRINPGDPQVVEIIDFVPGLPAERVLRIGDRITAIDGEALQWPGELTEKIQSRRPGEKVALTVLRPMRDERGQPIANEQGKIEYEPIEISLELGSAELLRDPATGRPQTGGQLEQQRLQEAAAIERRFRREPRRIELAGELPEPARPVVDVRHDPSVERHPTVQFVRRYIELSRARTITFDAQFVQDQLNSIRAEVARPDIPNWHREHLRRVLDRCEELLADY